MHQLIFLEMTGGSEGDSGDDGEDRGWLRLRGRTVVVAGASRDLGLRTAELLTAEGARVIRLVRPGTVPGPTPGVPAGSGLEVDLTDEAAVAALPGRLAAGGAEPDGLVCVAGPRVRADTPLFAPDDVWRRALDEVLLPAQRLCRALTPGMARRGRGSVVLVGAHSARSHAPARAHYAAMKAALAHLTVSWATELAPSGVRVNAVQPGWVATGAMRSRAADSEAEARLVAETEGSGFLTHRFGTLDEHAAVIAFLISDRAAYVNAVNLPVDGGSWLR